ncbi:hypothetical protein FA13DRAFT_1920627 [Coprinellus micaceus]|uniref:CCHC-type domain-containing protein n=1 Tax=Coprinellus micaceus TaxID=71717 RepID=A0A4Y7SKN9_COPMI|nr:hypothetical protein FA13DRAFT_1920627 [Coprinellus micaceus]
MTYDPASTVIRNMYHLDDTNPPTVPSQHSGFQVNPAQIAIPGTPAIIDPSWTDPPIHAPNPIIPLATQNLRRSLSAQPSIISYGVRSLFQSPVHGTPDHRPMQNTDDGAPLGLPTAVSQVVHYHPHGSENVELHPVPHSLTSAPLAPSPLAPRPEWHQQAPNAYSGPPGWAYSGAPTWNGYPSAAPPHGTSWQHPPTSTTAPVQPWVYGYGNWHQSGTPQNAAPYPTHSGAIPAQFLPQGSGMAPIHTPAPLPATIANMNDPTVLDQLLRRIAVLENPSRLSTLPRPPQLDDYSRMMHRLNILEEENLTIRHALANQRNLSPTTPRTKPPKIEDPEIFDGSGDRLETFLTQLSLVWCSDPDLWKDHNARIRFALSRMRKGTAAAWVETIMPSYLNGSLSWDSWDAFVTKLESKFPGSKQEGQGNPPAEDFFIAFENEAVHTGLNDAGLLLFAREALPNGLRERISLKHGLLSLDTYEKFRDAAIDIDRDYRLNLTINRKVKAQNDPISYDPSRPTNKFPGNGSTSNAPWRRPRDGVPSANTPTTSNTNTSSTREASKGKPPIPDEAKRLASLGCYNCHQQGHKADKCPLPRRQTSHIIREIISDLPDEDIDLPCNDTPEDFSDDSE